MTIVFNHPKLFFSSFNDKLDIWVSVGRVVLLVEVGQRLDVLPVEVHDVVGAGIRVLLNPKDGRL